MRFVMRLSTIGCIIISSLCQTSFASAVKSSEDLLSQGRLLEDGCSNNPLDPNSDAGAQMSSLLFSSYENKLYLPTKSDPCNGMTLHWKIIDSSKIQIGVTVKSNSQGWAGIGFSETGGMKGADVVYYEAATNKLVDAHVGDGYAMPMKDQLSQDWSLLSSNTTDDGYISFEAERALIVASTPGHEDHNIVNDSSVWVANRRIIGAWGSGTTMSFHNKNVVQGAVQLFSDDNGNSAGNAHANFLADMAQRSDGHAILKLSDYQVPSVITTYDHICFSVNDLVDLGLYEDVDATTHIIGIEYIVDANTAKYVHHMVVHGQYSDFAGTDPDTCNFDASPPFAAWAPGGEATYFPKGSGFEVGNVANSVSAIWIEYHFNNPDNDENIIDNGSGVKIYYTNQKSTIDNEIGMMITGDGPVNLRDQSIGNGKTKHDFTCPSECSKTSFDVDEITVVAESHHMHATGRRLVNTLYSEDGKELNTATLDYFDFDQNGSVLVRQEPYKMKRGDYYTTTCYYESNQDTVWGLGSSEEMCITFAYYYPKQPRFFPCSPENAMNPACSAQHTKTMLETDSNFGRPLSLDLPTNSPTSASSSFSLLIGICFLPLVAMYTNL